MSEIIRVKVFDFINSDQNYHKKFNRNNVENFLDSNKTKLNLKNGKYNCLLSHRSRLTSNEIIGNNLYNYISPSDAPLINRDLVGIIKDMFIQNENFFSDIELIPNDNGKLISMLISMGVKLSVSISFLDCSEIDSIYHTISELQGIDITLDPAFSSADVMGLNKYE